MLILNNYAQPNRWRPIINFFRKGIIFRVILYAILFLFFFQFAYIYFCKYYFPPFTFIQLEVHQKYPYTFKKKYVEYSKISPYVRLAVIGAEDATFASHNGFSWEGIEKALQYNKNHPNRVKGASTISQQTAKNVFLWNKRTWARKVLEVYFTTMIEWLWGKKRIMEVYLNVIEMGPGIIGIEEAAWHFYKKHAYELSINEAAMIASCLPNPKFLNPLNPSTMLQKKHSRVVKNMFQLMEQDEIKSLIK